MKSRLIWVISTAQLIITVLLLGYTGRDDSHISYYVADQIAAGNGIINYTGDAVEQSSTLLFVFCAAMIGKVTGLSAADFGPVLSFVFLLVTCWALLQLLRRYEVPSLGAVAAIMTSSAIYWSLSGMENSLYLLSLIAFMAAFLSSLGSKIPRKFFVLAAVSLLIGLVRPEGPIVIMSVAIAAFVVQKILRISVGIWSVLAVAIGVGCTFLFRLAIGLELFPNPVYAKQAIGLSERFEDGASYFLATAQMLPLSSMIALCAMLYVGVVLLRGTVPQRVRALASVSLLFCGSVIGFAFFAGGDWMENGRFLVPAYVLSIVAVMCCVDRNWAKAIAICVLFATAGETLVMSRKPWGGYPVVAADPVEPANFKAHGIDRFNTFHARDLSFVDEVLAVLKADPREDLILGSNQAGAVMFYLHKTSDKRIEFVDFEGLASKHALNCEGGRLGWQAEWGPFLDCLGVRPDYVFNLDYKNGMAVANWETQACVPVVDLKLATKTWFWKRTVYSQQFLMRCDWADG